MGVERVEESCTHDRVLIKTEIKLLVDPTVVYNKNENYRNLLHSNKCYFQRNFANSKHSVVILIGSFILKLANLTPADKISWRFDKFRQQRTHRLKIAAKLTREKLPV